MATDELLLPMLRAVAPFIRSLHALLEMINVLSASVCVCECVCVFIVVVVVVVVLVVVVVVVVVVEEFVVATNRSRSHHAREACRLLPTITRSAVCRV
jgi:hypothetical protein